MTESEAYIALNMMEKVGPVGVRSLVTALGSARAIFDADLRALAREQGIARNLVEAILAQRDQVDWKGELDRAASMGIDIIPFTEERYPAALREIHDPPLALYARGSLQTRDRHAIAVVGTRQPTHYGQDVAERISFQLAQSGFVVVSGLARGIDTAAHSGAIKAKGRTLAVIGSGLDRVYPESNAELAGQVSSHGAVLSEYPLRREPDKATFPVRNRIVSGLSMGVLVVEAGAKSGALITARQALEQGRSVFAIPGRIDAPKSFGTNRLVREGAKLVQSVDDVLAEFEFLIPPEIKRTAEQARPGLQLSEEEERLVGLLNDGPTDVDGLIRSSGLTAAAVNGLLIGLEMKRAVRMLPGRMIEPAGGGTGRN